MKASEIIVGEKYAVGNPKQPLHQCGIATVLEIGQLRGINHYNTKLRVRLNDGAIKETREVRATEADYDAYMVTHRAAEKQKNADAHAQQQQKLADFKAIHDRLVELGVTSKPNVRHHSLTVCMGLGTFRQLLDICAEQGVDLSEWRGKAT